MIAHYNNNINQPNRRGNKMNNQLKEGLSLHTHISQFSGETIYTICDHVGVVFTTIFENRLDRFYEAA